jgi:hypothetical protein
MSSGSRKTRGPRTPDERAHDALRTTATLFEKLPESSLGDEVLKPFASFLRFYTRPPSARVSLREVRQLEHAERDLADFISGPGKLIEYMPVAEGLRIERAVQRVQGMLRAAKAQLAAQLTEEVDDA